MESSELAFATTQELIAELVRRKTFMGVVVHAENEWKNGQWPAEQFFRAHFNDNLAPEEAGRLLNRVADYISLGAS